MTTVQKHLASLCSRDFVSRVGFVSTPESLRALIRSTPESRALAKDLRTGQLTEDGLSAFLNPLLAGIRKGERFHYEEVLASIAVLLESHPAQFAEEFIKDLEVVKGRLTAATSDQRR